MNEKTASLVRLMNKIYRCTQVYTDEALEKFQLSSGTYPYLMVLSRCEGISQKQISKELNVDKAMSARVIKKLIELGYVEKQEDEKDCRACKLFLTDKAKSIVPEIKNDINKWIGFITEGFDEEENEFVADYLEKVLFNAKRYRKNDKEEI
ncbi:MAG: MarR family winged helix-turn-helix transcriptional regulator [Bacillota bacterium]|nr:MarR family winged helix-turn-helix transcriptional regulator [Bacillota bacterium]